MIFLYPESCIYSNKIDSDFIEQSNVAIKNGFDVGIVSENFSINVKNYKGPAIYRGWMLKENEYKKLYYTCLQNNIILITSPKEYLNTHYMRNWYDKLINHTPETVFFNSVENINLSEIPNWDKYFVKDYVKSLTTKRGSIANNKNEIYDICNEIIKYRGSLEGGICVRKYENFIFDSEERIFVYKNIPYSINGNIIPEICYQIIPYISSNFYSIDIIKNIHNEYRLVELGDGQVSDLKKWDIENFYLTFRNNG